MTGPLQGKPRGTAVSKTTHAPATRAAAPAKPAPKSAPPKPAFDAAKKRALSLTGARPPVAMPRKVDAALTAEISMKMGKLVGAAAVAVRAVLSPGMNVGAQGVNDPVIPAAQAKASSVASNRVDWRNPTNTLNELTQFGATNSGNDAVRCGAATLVAGAILRGPVQFTKGLEAVVKRGGDLGGKYQELASKALEEADRATDPRMKAGLEDFAAKAGDFANKVDDATATLEKFAEKDPRTLTVGDLKEIQEAVYTLANCDQRLISARKFDPENTQANAYLSVGAMKTYGDLMWGGPPSLNREQLTPMLVDNKAGGAHFVLAGSDGKVAYNPWPEADGSAYVRAKDGDGAKVVAGEAGLGQLKGASVGSYRKELPSRS